MNIPLVDEKTSIKLGLRSSKFNSIDRKFLTILEDCEDFETEVLNNRKTLDIPATGLDISTDNSFKSNKSIETLFFDELFFKITQGSKKLNKLNKKIIKPDILIMSMDLCRKFGLSEEWINSMTIYLLFNFMIPPVFFSPIHLMSFSQVMDYQKDPWSDIYSKYLYIEIKQSVSKKKFIKWIESIWPTIESKLNEKYQTTPRVKIQDIGIKRRIYDLRNNKNTFNKIADILSHETGRVFDEDVVKNTFHRYLKLLKSLKK